MKYGIRKVNFELYHHGVLNQKWGVRRYQNKDGSLTDLGRRHYGYSLRDTFTKWRVRAKEKSAEHTQKKEAAKVRKEESEYKKHRRLIEYGTIDEIKKNISKISPEEMTELRNRFSTELQVREQMTKIDSYNKPISTISAPTKNTPAYTKITNGTKFMADNASNLSRTVIQANMFYNGVAKASNALLGTSLRLIT